MEVFNYMDTQTNYINERDDEGDFRVSVKSMAANNKLHEIKTNRYRYPGFSHPSKESGQRSSPFIHAKLLGRTYKAPTLIKGKITMKSKQAMKTIQFKRILIPTYFSETGSLAMGNGNSLARLFKAELYLLHESNHSTILIAFTTQK